MPVYLSDQSTNSQPLDLLRLRRTAETLLKLAGHQASELSILLVSDPGMRELNRQYRKKDQPTNVLAFPLAEKQESRNGAMLGDVVISLETAAREAIAKGVPLRRRVIRLLIHGLVHLLGLDHERSEQEADQMLNQEENLLADLIQTERRKTMTQLAINVDHIATLRQARGIKEPDPVLAAGICELAGARGIVVHLREDRRHIQDRDVLLLRETVKSKLNLEMGATEEIIRIALKLKPDLITLVPEKREELTTEGGLDVLSQTKKLSKVVGRMATAGIPVSLFIDPDQEQIRAALDVGATFVEIHTGRYCDAESEAEMDEEFDLIAESAEFAFHQGLRVNAGHGLNYLNTGRVATLDAIEELSIGHAVMARAIMVGLEQAVREMATIVRNGNLGLI